MVIIRHCNAVRSGLYNKDCVGVCAAFEKLKREAEVEDAKKTELWTEVCALESLHVNAKSTFQVFGFFQETVCAMGMTLCPRSR